MDCQCGSSIQPNTPILNALDAFGRQRLSKHYFMRDFLYSEIAEAHGIANVPDDAELAIKSGTALCRNLLEPLRHVFGHVTIRSAFRSANVNGFGNCHNMNCSSNKASYANHIWDHKDDDGFMGATACIVIPGFVDWMNEKAGRDWRVLAWFIHDHLPCSEMVFFVQNAAVNLTWRGDPHDHTLDDDVLKFDGSCGSIVWRSEPRRRISSFQEPKGLMMKNGEAKKEEGDRCQGLVEAWKAAPEQISFEKWRSREVCNITNAWMTAGNSIVTRCSGHSPEVSTRPGPLQPRDERWTRKRRRLKACVGCYGERPIDFLRTSLMLPDDTAQDRWSALGSPDRP